MIDLTVSPWSGWTYGSYAAPQVSSVQTPPDAAQVGTNFGFLGGYTNGFAALYGIGVIPGGPYRLRWWVNGAGAHKSASVTQTLELDVDRGDGAFTTLATLVKTDAPGWTEMSHTFTANGPVARIQLRTEVPIYGPPYPVGTFYWLVDDIPAVAAAVTLPENGQPPRLGQEWREDALTGILRPFDELQPDYDGRIRRRGDADALDRHHYARRWVTRTERKVHEP